MANPYHHACSRPHRRGGKPADYPAIHDGFDASKEFMPDFFLSEKRRVLCRVFQASQATKTGKH